MVRGKILLEISKLNEGWSGVEKTLLTLREMLLEIGCEVDVLVSSKKINIQIISDYEFETLSREEVDFGKYSIIILSLEGSEYYELVEKVHGSSSLIIKIVHGDPKLLVERYEFDYLKMYRAYNLCDKIVVLNEKYLNSFPSDLKYKTTVIPHYFKLKDNSKQIDSKLITYVGRLDEPNKQVISLLNVWKELKKIEPEALFEIYGDGPSKQFYLKKIKKEKLKDVYIKPKTDDVLEVYNKSKICILFSKHEGLPLTFIESATNGTLTLTSKDSDWVSGVVIDELKVNVNDIKLFVNSVINFLNMDLELYNVLVSKQQELLFANMNEDKVSAMWKNLILDLKSKSNKIPSRILNSFIYENVNNNFKPSKDKLKEEYDKLLAKYHYVLKLLAKK